MPAPMKAARRDPYKKLSDEEVHVARLWYKEDGMDLVEVAEPLGPRGPTCVKYPKEARGPRGPTCVKVSRWWRGGGWGGGGAPNGPHERQGTVTSQSRHSHVTVTSQSRHSHVMRNPGDF